MSYDQVSNLYSAVVLTGQCKPT